MYQARPSSGLWKVSNIMLWLYSQKALLGSAFFIVNPSIEKK
jgi:hypothetical protein